MVYESIFGFEFEVSLLGLIDCLKPLKKFETAILKRKLGEKLIACCLLLQFT